MDWMLLPLRRYARFTGRARRKEYWMFTLFVVLVTIALSVVEAMLGIGSGSSSVETMDYGFAASANHNVGWLGGLFTLAMIVPSIAVSVRRMHDLDRSGWWVLIGLIPLIGAIVLFIFCVTSGTRGPNRFGLDPVTDGAAQGDPAG